MLIRFVKNLFCQTHKKQPDEEKGSDVESESETPRPPRKSIDWQSWKHIGYRNYAEFIASDNDLFIFRQFRELNTRVALRLQDQVSVLETELKMLDDLYSAKRSVLNRNGSFRNDVKDRKTILDQTEEALNRYNTFLSNQSYMRQLPRASRRDVKNIKIWHQEYDHRAIDGDEHSYLDEGDLVCLSRQDKTPLRHLIDSSIRLWTLSIWRNTSLPSTGELRQVRYLSEKKMNAFVSTMIVFTGTAILIIPMWILERMDDLDSKLVVITIFIFVFLVALSSVMVTKPFEALAATAAYAAVLMVFIQVGG